MFCADFYQKWNDIPGLNRLKKLGKKKGETVMTSILLHYN